MAVQYNPDHSVYLAVSSANEVFTPYGGFEEEDTTDDYYTQIVVERLDLVGDLPQPQQQAMQYFSTDVKDLGLQALELISQAKKLNVELKVHIDISKLKNPRVVIEEGSDAFYGALKLKFGEVPEEITEFLSEPGLNAQALADLFAAFAKARSARSAVASSDPKIQAKAILRALDNPNHYESDGPREEAILVAQVASTLYLAEQQRVANLIALWSGYQSLDEYETAKSDIDPEDLLAQILKSI